MEILLIIAAAAIFGYVIYKIVHPGIKPLPEAEAVVFPAPYEPEAAETVIAPVENKITSEAAIAPVVEVASVVEVAPVATPKSKTKKITAPKTEKVAKPKATKKTQAK